MLLLILCLLRRILLSRIWARALQAAFCSWLHVIIAVTFLCSSVWPFGRKPLESRAAGSHPTKTFSPEPWTLRFVGACLFVTPSR